MAKRTATSRTYVAWLLSCAVLVAAHLHQHSDESAANPPRKPASIVETPRKPNPDADAAAWAAWRDRRAVSASDSRADRAAKGLTETMRGFRQQPVEFVEDEGKKSSLRVVTEAADLKAILDAGGSYSGPLPPELIPNDPPPRGEEVGEAEAAAVKGKDAKDAKPAKPTKKDGPP